MLGMNQKIQILLGFIKMTDDEIVALSPVCKHLGCTVDWNTNKQPETNFFCPCHWGLYTKDGTNVKGTPPVAPLMCILSKKKMVTFI